MIVNMICAVLLWAFSQWS